jgi:hypothetical protein
MNEMHGSRSRIVISDYNQKEDLTGDQTAVCSSADMSKNLLLVAMLAF